MKKSYKAPEVLVVELDTNDLCQTIVVRSLVDAAPEDDPEENSFSASYRTNLWGDN